MAVARLAASQKSKASVPAYLRYVNRPVGGQLAAVSYAVGLTPTQVTVLSTISHVLGISLLAVGERTAVVGVAVAVALALGYALDSADGQLARVRGGGTKAGEWLDHVADVFKLSSLHAAVLVSGLLHADHALAWNFVPLAFVVAQLTMFFGLMLRDQMLSTAGVRPKREADTSPVKSLALLPIDHGALCLVFVLLPWSLGFNAAYAALALYTSAFAVRALHRSYRSISAVDRSGLS